MLTLGTSGAKALPATRSHVRRHRDHPSSRRLRRFQRRGELVEFRVEFRVLVTIVAELSFIAFVALSVRHTPVDAVLG
jgi:hypothetical protein